MFKLSEVRCDIIPLFLILFSNLNCSVKIHFRQQKSTPCNHLKNKHTDIMAFPMRRKKFSLTKLAISIYYLIPRTQTSWALILLPLHTASILTTYIPTSHRASVSLRPSQRSTPEVPAGRLFARVFTLNPVGV